MIKSYFLVAFDFPLVSCSSFNALLLKLQLIILALVYKADNLFFSNGTKVRHSAIFKSGIQLIFICWNFNCGTWVFFKIGMNSLKDKLLPLYSLNSLLVKVYPNYDFFTFVGNSSRIDLFNNLLSSTMDSLNLSFWFEHSSLVLAIIQSSATHSYEHFSSQLVFVDMLLIMSFLYWPAW